MFNLEKKNIIIIIYNDIDISYWNLTPDSICDVKDFLQWASESLNISKANSRCLSGVCHKSVLCSLSKYF